MPLFLEPGQTTGSSYPNPGTARLDSGSLVIGRGEDADLRLGNPVVSRRHCVVSGDGARWQVVDQSTSGTLLNGERLAAPRALQHGDVISVGDTDIRVRIETGATPGASPPANPAAGAGALNLDSWGNAARRAPNPAPAAAANGAARTSAPVTLSNAPAVPQPTGPGSPLDTVLRAAGLYESGLNRASIALDDQALAVALGTVLRGALGGLATLAQDRQRARRDLKLTDEAKANPVLAQRDPGALLAQLLGGDGAAALDSASRALDAHQRAALGAWQATFAATLDQFAPAAIRQRTSNDAAAWQAYEQAFAARDGFVETFAREFAKAYRGLAGD